MYAVIETGGKQYRVELGTEIEVDRMDVQPGQTIAFDRVLLVADGDESSIGAPLVDGARVDAAVVRQTRGEKLIVFKYKPKARSRVKNGARADLTLLRIADIAWAGRSAAEEHAAVAAEQRAAAEAAAKAAAAKAAADQALAARLAAETAAADAEAAAAETETADAEDAAAETAAAEAEAAPESAAPVEDAADVTSDADPETTTDDAKKDG